MKKILLMFVLCVGLTDAAYRNEVVKIVAKNLPADDDPLNAKFAYVMIRKLVRYKNDGGGAGSTEDTASRCFAKDLYKDVYGVDATLNPGAVHGIKHWIGENFPGQEFEP